MNAAFKPAFWVLVWVFSVQHPGGQITDRSEFYKNRYPFMACDATAKALDHRMPAVGESITTDGGTVRYSRFVCVPVP